MAGKFYAVKKGRKSGIYRSWDECKSQVDGFSGAIYKSFKTLSEAEAFMGIDNKICTEDIADTENNAIEKADKTNSIYAFVDGSFNKSTGVYGFGGFLIADGKKYILQGSGNDKEMASMRNVAGEVLGSMAAMEKAIELGIKELDIYYDYVGIEMWATGQWKRNKAGTIAYYDYVASIKDQLRINFIKVKGHSGVDGNEEADRLAKMAVGIM